VASKQRRPIAIKPTPIQKKDNPERQAKDTTGVEDNTQNKVEAETIESARQAESKNKRERFREWANKWNNVLLIVVPSVFSLLVLAAIWVQAYIYEKQWRSMQASIEETKRNRELEYRAYVVVKGAGVVPQPNLPLGRIIVTTFNSGRTPGVGKIKAVLRFLRDSPPEDSPVDIAEEQSRIVFGPLVDINTPVSLLPIEQPSPSPLPGTEHTKAKSSPSPASPAVALPADMQAAPPDRYEFYVFGYIEYTDIFHKTHWTKFCVYNIPGTDRWTYCPTFNDAN
jgi:hypothetical protein